MLGILVFLADFAQHTVQTLVTTCAMITRNFLMQLCQSVRTHDLNYTFEFEAHPSREHNVPVGFVCNWFALLNIFRH
jgi:hypothetical protein